MTNEEPSAEVVAISPPPPPPPVATPQITSPANFSSQTAGQNLPVDVDINVDTVSYRFSLTDTTTAPFPPATSWDVTPTPPATQITTTIAGSQLAANKTYQIHVMVKPSDGTSPPNLTDSVNIST